MRSNEYTNIHFCAQKVAIQDDVDWCLDFIAEHYRCEMNHVTPDSVGEKAEGVYEKARQRGLVAQSHNAVLDELPLLQSPTLVRQIDGRFIVMVARGKQGAMFVTSSGSEAEHIKWDDLAKIFSGVVVKVSPMGYTRPPKKVRVPLSRLTGNLGDLTGATIRIGVLAVGIELCLIVSPLFMKLVLDRVLPAVDGPLLATSAIFFFILVALQMLLHDVRSQALIKFSQRINLRWLSNLFTHLVRLPISFFEQRSVGDVASKFWSVAHIQRTLAVGFIEGALDGLMALVTALVLVVIVPQLAGLPAAALLFYIILRWRCLKRQRKAEHERSQYSVVQQSHIWETISGIQSVKLFQRENNRLEGWLAHVSQLFDGDRSYQEVEASLRTNFTALMAIERVIVIALGAWMTMQQTITIAQLIVFLAYNELFLNRSFTLTNKLAEIALLDGHRDKVADIALHEPEASVAKEDSFDIQGGSA
ncbi:MAG: hypothetical protein KKA05_10070, partial [Alphaproteobacteria bacterium]|nr:hypothetical protein [Alphaproteobacteria bacterium]